jgi:hypothetical protein
MILYPQQKSPILQFTTPESIDESAFFFKKKKVRISIEDKIPLIRICLEAYLESC